MSEVTKDNQDKAPLTNEAIEQCIATLRQLNDNTEKLADLTEAQRVDLMIAAGRLTRPDRDTFIKRRKKLKKVKRDKSRERDKHARKITGIRSAREANIFVAPKMIEAPKREDIDKAKLASPRNCYVCKEKYEYIHHFYDSMCTACGDFNYAKRFQKADMTGQVAIVT